MCDTLGFMSLKYKKDNQINLGALKKSNFKKAKNALSDTSYLAAKYSMDTI